MPSVTQRINEVKQPRGGYIKPSKFEVTAIVSTTALNAIENVPPTIIGLAVDYMTRFMLGTPVSKVFEVSIVGAEIAEQNGIANAFNKAVKLAKSIEGTDRQSIINVCKLVTFDVWFRNSTFALCSKTNCDDVMPDDATIENIRIMVERSLAFFDSYGAVIESSFTFGTDGYTETVSSGDGDFLTKDTLWDFKVLKNKPNNKHTLQLLMYWIMGQHSKKEVFKTIDKIGIFNPRQNMVYTLKIEDIPKQTIEEVEKNVICY